MFEFNLKKIFDRLNVPEAVNIWQYGILIFFFFFFQFPIIIQLGFLYSDFYGFIKKDDL
jgi:hypothetical protein